MERSSRVKDKVRMCRSRSRYYNSRTVLIFLLYFGSRLQSNQSDYDIVLEVTGLQNQDWFMFIFNYKQSFILSKVIHMYVSKLQVLIMTYPY